ncbi:MAG: hypothetical protein M1826_001351 [Phylliscum demangeonii]|nr:MAG: hypothetical protein M1826_001351 [Phylliscum demangeonii]
MLQTTASFGLIDRAYDTEEPSSDAEGKKTQWQRFRLYVEHLNAQCDEARTTAYRVLFVGRHGEGYHNLAETRYGAKEWDARKAHGFWKRSTEEDKLPVPQKYFVSPLFRCLQTVQETFGGLQQPLEAPFIPVVKEV